MRDWRAPASGVAGNVARTPRAASWVSRERYSVRASPGAATAASRHVEGRADCGAGPLARSLQPRHRAEEFERRIAAAIGIALEQTRRSRLRPAPARRGARNRSTGAATALAALASASCGCRRDGHRDRLALDAASRASVRLDAGWSVEGHQWLAVLGRDADALIDVESAAAFRSTTEPGSPTGLRGAIGVAGQRGEGRSAYAAIH